MTRHVLVAALLCAAAAAQTVTVSVFLSNEASGDIPSLAQEVSDPRSARYGQYMSRSQVAEKFGAPPAAADAVKAWFKANTKASSVVLEPTADLIHAVMPATAANQLFTPKSALHKSFEAAFGAKSKDAVLDVVTSPFGTLAFDDDNGNAARRSLTHHPRVAPVRLGRRNGDAVARAMAQARERSGGAALAGDGKTFAPIDMVMGQAESVTVYLNDAFVAGYNATWQSFELRVKQQYDDGVTQTQTFRGPIEGWPVLRNLQNYDEATISMRVTAPGGAVGPWLQPPANPISGSGRALPAQVKTTPVLRQMYSVPRGARSVDARASQAVAEFSSESFSPPLLDMYRAAMGQAPVDVVVDGPNPIDEMQVGEGALDVQTITTLAPDAQTSWIAIDGSVGQGFVLEYAAKVNGMEGPPLVHSISWGAPESAFPKQYIERLDLELAKLALRGVSMIMASGDNGINSNGASCSFTPGVLNGSPWVTVVGATQFSRNAVPYCDPSNAQYRAEFGECSEVGEVVCSTRTGAIITSSGGFSNVRGRPWYQNTGDAVARYVPQISSSIIAQGVDTSKRGFPDVAAAGHSFAVFANESFGLYDGTSAASPTFAAIVTLLNAQRLAAGQPQLGFLNPLLYDLAQSTPAAFNDITVGNNGATEMESCAHGFDAAPRWDAVTGHGSPNYEVLRRAVLASGAKAVGSDAGASAPRASAQGQGGVRGARPGSNTTDGTTVAAIAVVGAVAVAALLAVAAVLRRRRAAAAALPPVEPPAASSAEDDTPYRSSCSHDAGAPAPVTGSLVTSAGDRAAAKAAI